MVIIIFSFLLLLCTGFADYLSGYEMHFGSFYYLIVALAAWNTTRRDSLIFTLISLAVWIIADHFAGHKYPNQWVLYWNIINRAVVYFATAVTISTIKLTLEEQRRLIIQLRNTLLNLSEMKSHLSVCNVCHGFRDDAAHRGELVTYLKQHPDPISLGGVCGRCLDERTERIQRIPVDEARMRDVSDATPLASGVA